MASLDGPVSDFMQSEVVTLQREDRLDLADDIMRLGRVRHLPVLEGDQLVGILSSRDLLAASLSKALDFEPQSRRAFLRSVEVKEVMSQDVDTVTPDTPVREAGLRMLRRKIGCLPVAGADGSFVGLLAETDLLRAALGATEETSMNDRGRHGRFEEELETLRRVRDELRVQVHLGKAEAAELWEDLEHRFEKAESRVKELAQRANEPVQDVAEAARLLLDEIRSGYKRLRDLL